MPSDCYQLEHPPLFHFSSPANEQPPVHKSEQNSATPHWTPLLNLAYV